jgi:hypothetical protein
MKLGTAKELAALEEAAKQLADQPIGKLLRSLYEKHTKQSSKAKVGSDIAGIQDALVFWSEGKVVPIKGAAGLWAQQSNRYAAMGATPDDAFLVGCYLKTQPWCEPARYTIVNLAPQWPNFLAKAKALGVGREQHSGATWQRAEFEG